MRSPIRLTENIAVGPLSDWKGHIPALVALIVVLISLRGISFLTSPYAHPALVWLVLGMNAILVVGAVWDEHSKRRGRGD